MSQNHKLKTLAPYFDAVQRAEKLFEVRKDDRGFQKGDYLTLIRMDEASPWYEAYPSQKLHFKIGYILTGGQLGIEAGYVVLQLEIIPPEERGRVGPDIGRVEEA